MRYFETPSFRALQQAWYQRLEEEGFRDAEEIVAGEMVLRQNAEHPLAGKDALEITQRSDYYRALSAQVELEEFDSEIDRIVMTMIADGQRIQRVVETLTFMSERRPPCFLSKTQRARNTVRFIIRKYEQRWGIREHAPHELKPWAYRRNAS
jgi:hypothetical protein